MRLFVLLLALVGCVPATASAVTIEEVVTLSKSGVSEQVIVALIERDQTLFAMTPALIMKLQRDGVSDPILLALIKSGRPNEPLPASPVVPAPAEPPQAAAISAVGHGPDLPNASAAGSMAPPEFTQGPSSAPVPTPVFVPVPILVAVPSASPHPGRRSQPRPEPYLERTANPLLCVARVSSGPSPFSPALTRVTECPAEMPRYRN